MNWRERARTVLTAESTVDHPNCVAPTPQSEETSACSPTLAAWRVGLRQLREEGRPDFVRSSEWGAVMEMAERFLAQWGAKAEALGWSAGDLFSLHPEGSLARYAQRGAAFLLAGREVVAITADTITYRPHGGHSAQRYLRPATIVAAAWESLP